MTGAAEGEPKPPSLDRVRRHALDLAGVLGAGMWAEDVAADVVVKYVRYRPQAWRKWVAKTTATTVTDYWRTQPFYADPIPGSSPSDLDGGPPGPPFPHGLMAAGESLPVANRNLVIRMLDTLGPRERSIVFARFWRGLSSTEIAAALDYKNAASVDTVYGRAMGRLRRRFGDDTDLALDFNRRYL